nr:hypothetical protein [Planctomycetota bacterium]
MRPILVSVVVLLLARNLSVAAELPLRIDAPEPAATQGIPVSGGIPFARGLLASIDQLRLLDAARREIPAQATALAVWPDGSVKWALIDAVVTGDQGRALILEYGASVRRAAVIGPMSARVEGGRALVGDGHLVATIANTGAGFIDALAIDGHAVIDARDPAGVVVSTVRIPDGTSGDAIPVGSFLCRSAQAHCATGTIHIDAVTVESPGPIRATVLVRGAIVLPQFGATLPPEATRGDPAGRMPFSMRVSFFRGTSVVYAQHQIIFTGEPDCDFITRWAIRLPGLAGSRGMLCIEPGVTLEENGGRSSVAASTSSRLCWGPLAMASKPAGFALIRHGWYDRPAAITAEGGAAWIEFWPHQAGIFDLRRYAREWAAGESGDTHNPADMERYATYAARGIAKSQDLVVDFSPLDSASIAMAAPQRVTTLSERALLVAPPAWYAATQALGPMVPEQTSGPYAALEAMTRRRLDYHLFAQDLY